MNDININALLVRALKTFLQGFAAALVVSATTVTDLSTGKAAVIGGVAAGVSALMNLFLQPTEAK